MDLAGDTGFGSGAFNAASSVTFWNFDRANLTLPTIYNTTKGRSWCF